jgi:3D (Asp-Asp-Asp) domain-containing protein
MSTLSRRTALAVLSCAPFTARSFAKTASSAARCSDGWFVTGYYSAAESEFAGRLVQIDLEGRRFAFPADFLRKVKTDGWGQTRHSWFLGWNNGWRRGAAPLNIRGLPLGLGSVAVDRRLIPFGTELRIADLPAPWDTRILVADDGGDNIRGKWLDVYCGCGPDKRAEALRLTGHNHRVCFVTTA